MAFWDRIKSRGDVEDRRGLGPVAVGGLGVGGLAIYLLFNVFTGNNIDVGTVLNTIQNAQVQTQQDTSQYEGEDSYEVFASTVLGSNNDAWRKIFESQNRNYTEPKLVLFRESTDSACGGATSEVGPHYCSLDNTIYLDETFFDELQNRFGAGGDVAQAYVISHEVGHHVQNEMGTMEKIERFGNAQSNSINLELQADCYSGIWASTIKDSGVLEVGEINEAVNAAAAVGDDRIQEKVTGQVNPETWTHGSSNDRVMWFNRGYQSGDPASCDTFSLR